jgi:hypothetical protein
MTDIKSGWFQTGNNTPTGQPFKLAVDNPYITKDEYIQSFEASGMGITINSLQYQSGELDRKILQASAWINRFCGRWFDTQTIDQQDTGFTVRPMNPKLVTVVLKNRPYSKINTIYIQVLKWFIEVDTTATGYLQDFYASGFYKIVPLLSTSGTGVGSPLPAQIVDHVPLGVLWTNYTFGWGTPITGLTLTQIGNTLQYQAVLGKRLWAPDQPTVIYNNGVALVKDTDYTLDCPNGIVTMVAAQSGPITADFTSNESLPFEIKEACTLLVTHMIGQAQQNPMGATSMGIQTFNINFGDKSKVMERVEQLLTAYVNKMPLFLGL